jgi:ABC-2 type transport system permease protein
LARDPVPFLVVLAMIVKEFRELRRDRRTMGMLIALPLVLLVIFGYAANFGVDSVSTAVLGPGAESAAQQLPPLFDVTEVDPAGDRATGTAVLSQNRADAALVTGTSGRPVLLVDGSSLFTAQATVSAANRAGGALGVEVLFNPDLKTSWVMVPGLIGLILAFIGTIVTSLGLVRERQDGTLEQLAVMPFRPSDVIVGKIAPYFALAYLDMVAVTVLGATLFGVPFRGSVPLFGIGAVIFLLVVLGLGVLISTISYTQGQAIQTAMFFVMPQILLSGMIFPLDAMPWGVRWIGYLLPLTYFIDVSQGILLRGAGLGSLWISFAVLLVMAVVVLGGAVLRFRRDLAPELDRRGIDVGEATS